MVSLDYNGNKAGRFPFAVHSLNQIRAAFVDWAYQAAQTREAMLNKTTIAQAKATAANMGGPGYVWASKPRKESYCSAVQSGW